MGSGKDPLGILTPTQSPAKKPDDPLGILKKKDLDGISATGSVSVGGGGTLGSSAGPSGEETTPESYKPEAPTLWSKMPVGTSLGIGKISLFNTNTFTGKPKQEYKPEYMSEFNLNFDKTIGQPELDLGSDLPQIKKETERQRYLANREKETKIQKSVDNIYSLSATLKDFDSLKKESPKVFDKIKEDWGIERLPETTSGEQYKDENFVFNVFQDYQQKATEKKLELAQKRRVELDSQIQDNIASASQFTGSNYEVPQNLEQAKKIAEDINNKKAAIIFAATNRGGGLSDMLASTEEATKQIAAGEKIMPALTNLISGYVFEEEAKTNPNATPFDVGKKILKIVNPQQYELYEMAGGDKPYGQMFVNRAETPKSADNINRYITQLGVNAFQLFGNKAAIERADEATKSLRWQFTLPVEEETKHMIAARLKESGIDPRKATEEQKDLVAAELPEVNRGMWFDKNKVENNTTLPTTGFWSSTKGSYFNTVEDATKSMLGWMMPGRNRERALDVLKGQTSSDVLGENPASIQRLDYLKKKESEGLLTDEEKLEKDELSKYTDIRTGWQRFKDLSGIGVGQFAGFGTISAFTGGLGNARSGAGAIKSLISPMADRGGMLAAGYLMSREANARDAVEMFPGESDGIKRFVYGEAATAIDTFVERIFPEEKFLSGIFKNDLAKLIPKLTQQNLRKELNEGLAEKIAKGFIKKVAVQQGTPLQEGVEEGLAAFLKDTFKGTLNPEYNTEPITFDEIVNTATQAYLSSQFLGVPKGVFAQKNKSVPLNAIWDAASNEGVYEDVKFTVNELLKKGDLTQDEANERISLLNTARKNWEDNPILSGGMGNLSLPKRQNYLGRLMNEAVLQKKADAATDENVKATLNKQISESKKARKAIYDGETFVTPYNEEAEVKQLTPQQIILQQAEEGKLPGTYGEMLQQYPEMANDVLIDYAKQKYGVSDNGADLEGGGRPMPSKEVDEAVIKMFPDKESLVADMKGKASVSKVNQIAKDAGEQIMPILQRINDADYINEAELNQAADRLYEIMDEVDKSDMTDEQKKSSLNLIEPVINKLEGYEFRTTTETGTTTETKANVVPRKVEEKTKKPALEQSEGTAVSVTGPSGTEVTGILRIENGKYVVINEAGNKEAVLGEKAITDRDLSLPDEEEMENPVEFDDDGNVKSVTFKTKDGSLIKINTPEKALDLAIQLRADMIGEVSPQEFDIVYEEVQKPFTKEVLVTGKENVKENTPEQQTPESIPVERGEKTFEQRTDKEHATYIKDKFVEEFTKKGVPREQALAATALMEARAKASGLGDEWYRQIEDIGNGEFQDALSDIKYQGEWKKILIAAALAIKPLQTADTIKTPVKQDVVQTGGVKQKEVIKKLVEDYFEVNGEKAPVDVINRAIQLWEIYNKPDILSDSTSKDERAYTSGNTEAVPTQDPDLSVIVSVKGVTIGNITDFDDFIAEISHAAQYRSGGILNQRNYKYQEDRDKYEYERKGSLEYDAHKLIEPYLAKYVLTGHKGDTLVLETVKAIPQNIINELMPTLQKYNIKFQVNKGALETLKDGRMVIHALDAPDFSTMVHEIAHVFESDLTEAETKLVKDFGGSEAFARGFERYLRNGIAPSREMIPLFQKFRTWLMSIYESLVGSPIEKRITPEIKQIFDRLLTEQSLSNETPNKQEEGEDLLSSGQSKPTVLEGKEKNVGNMKLPKGAKEIYHYSENESLSNLEDREGGTWFTDNSYGYQRRGGVKGKVSKVIEPANLNLASEKEVWKAGEGDWAIGVKKIKEQGFDGVKQIVDGDRNYLIFDLKKLKDKSEYAVKPQPKDTQQTPKDETTKESIVTDEPVSPKKALVTETEPIEDSKGAGQEPPKTPPVEAVVEGDGEYTGITHAQTNEIARELGFPEYEESPETVEGWDIEAEKRIKEGGMPAVIRKLEEGNMPSKVEQRMMAKYIASLKAEINKNPTNEKLREQKYAIELSNIIGGREVAKSLYSRRGQHLVDDDLAGFMLRDQVELGQDELTEGQMKNIEAEYRRIEKAQKEFDEWVAKKEEEITMRQAGLNVQEMVKGKRPASKLQSLNEERKSIISDILNKAATASKDGASFLGVKELAAIAPDVLKLAKNLVETGVVGVKELTSMIHDMLKTGLPDLEENQIREIIAGKHTEKKKPTKSDLAIKWRDLTEEAKLIEKYEALMRGEEPKTEKAKIERNQQITELRKQIKEHDLTKLASAKNRIQAEIKKIEQQLKSGDFSKPEKSEIKWDEEGRKLQRELVEARKLRDIRIQKQKYEKRTANEKRADFLVKVMNAPRSLMASLDFSAPLNQGIVATIGYPDLASAAIRQMLRATASKNAFDEWFRDLKESPRYDMMKETGLKISDPDSPFLGEKEEAFMNGYVERIPGLGVLIKKSERAYVQYLNKIRVDLFNRFISQFEDDGKSYKNSKELYKKTARFINNITGSGTFVIPKIGRHGGQTMDTIAPFLNTLFFAPRMIASRINLLNPYYVYSLPPELRKEWVKSMGKYVALQGVILSLFSIYGKYVQDDDDENKITVEFDPRSPDFGKIKQGDTRWSFNGGFQPYVTLYSKLLSGKAKSSSSGLIREIDGDDLYSPSSDDMILRFLRGKLAPVPGMALDIRQGENVVGEKTTLLGEAKGVLPFSVQSIIEAWDQYGALSFLNIAAPSIGGVGVQTYEPKKREVKQEIPIQVTKNGKRVDAAVELTDEQYDDYKGKVEKYIEKDVKEMESVAGYKDLSPEERQAIKRNVENAAVRKAKDEVIKKYKYSLEKKAVPKEKSDEAEKIEKEVKKRLED